MEKENVVLIGVLFPSSHSLSQQNSLSELKELAKTADAKVLDILTQSRMKPDVRTFIGRGKAEEIANFYSKEKVDLLIINHDISPTQVRNLEEITGLRTITRTELILDIFARHASSTISRLQVELAQQQYRLPRLIGKGKSMSRTLGGIGLRGPGETQLETDRRHIRRRITTIKRKLKEIAQIKETQVKSRQKEFKIAIVGYTNAGKSTLLNALVKSDVLAENKLFATLETTTRRLWLEQGVQVLLTDTVGFIQDLPHLLIESFKSTLKDTLNADLILHLADASSNYGSKILVVEQTLHEIGAANIPSLLCFNKIDCLQTRELLDLKYSYPNALFLSATKKENLEILKEIIKKKATLFLKEKGRL